MQLARTPTRESSAPAVEIEVRNGERSESTSATLSVASARPVAPLPRRRSPLDPHGSAQPAAAAEKPGAHARAASSAPEEHQRAMPSSARRSVEAVLPTAIVCTSRPRTLVADGRRGAGGRAPLTARSIERERESAPRSRAFFGSGERGGRESDSEAGEALARRSLGSVMLY